jgi:V8-like Glu-specific endopeptidase
MKLTLILLLTTSTLFAQNKVIYGDDNRKDLYEVRNQKIKELARSTAAMVKYYQVAQAGNRMSNITGMTLGMRGICDDQRFVKQLSAAECTGFLVAPDILVTAGHCIQNQYDCENNRWVFDFAINDPQQVGNQIQVPMGNVYGCKEIIHQELNDRSRMDYAVIRLDRKVTDRAPLKVRTEGKLRKRTSLFVIGHPSGLPTKVADHAYVRRLKSNYFVANLDTFGGNSGSPVFNQTTLEVEGILVRGDKDYNERRRENCLEVKHCRNRGCKGEEVTRITSVPLGF